MRISRIHSGNPASFLVAIALGLPFIVMLGASVNAQEATPSALSCAGVTSRTSTPMAGHDAATPEGHDGHDMSATDEMPEFDLAYIDMMIPHHQSIIALARVAAPELDDPRLIDMAKTIIDTQEAEIDELEGLRAEWYGDAEAVSMGPMMQLMPGMGPSMETMSLLMSAEYLVTTFCDAENKDLAFIELTIPHHQMAVDASEDALEQAVHPELAELAEGVIESQQAEIDLLIEIREDLVGEATPAG